MMSNSRAQALHLNPISLAFLGLMLITSWEMSYASEEHSDHSSHSDVLLILLQHKIKVQKLQTQFTAIKDSGLDQPTAQKNLQSQANTLHRASKLLEKYLAIPETRYPNMDMYHQSLISRGGLLTEFAGLLKTFQQQSSKIFND